MSQPGNQMQAEMPDYVLPPAHPVTPEPEPAKLGPWQRLIGTLFSPGETFQDVNRKPTWLIPVLLIMVSAAAFMIFFNSQTDEGWRLFMREQMSRQSGGAPSRTGDLDTGIKIMKWSYVGGAFIFSPIYYLIIAGAFALVMLIMQAQTTFKRIFSVVIWSACGTGLVQAIVNVASLLARDSESLSRIGPKELGTISATNLAVALPGSSPALLALGTALDIFSIWFLILLVIGFKAISGSRKITKGKIAGIVFGLWLLTIVLKVAGASMFGR